MNLNDNDYKPLPKDVYESFGCLICEEDFYSAEYYDPEAHWQRFIEDVEWNERMARRALEKNEKIPD